MPEYQKVSSYSRSVDSYTFWLLLLGFASFGPIALSIFKPTLPWIEKSFNVAVDTVQLAPTFSILAATIPTFIAGRFADTLGRRPLMLLGGYLYLLSSILCAVAGDIWTLIIGRIAQSMSGTVGMVVVRSMVLDVYGRERSTAVFGYLSFAATFFVLMTPIVGGLIIEWRDWRATFLLTALLGGVLSLFSTLFLPETLHKHTAGSAADNAPIDGKQLFRAPEFLGYVIPLGLHFGCSYALFTAGTYILVDKMDRPAYDFGFWFFLVASGVIAGVLLSYRISKLLGNSLTIFTGTVIAFIGGIGSLILLPREDLTPLMMFGPAILSGIGGGMIMPGSQSGAVGVNPAKAGTASGLVSFAQYVFAAIFSHAAVNLTSQINISLAWISIFGTGLALLFGILPVIYAPDYPGAKKTEVVEPRY